MKKLVIFLVLLPVLVATNSFAQQTKNQQLENSDPHDLYIKGHYGAARHAYSKLISADELFQEYEVEKEYYISSSAAELEHGDATVMVENFIKKHPESTRTDRAWLQLGHLYFRNNSYRSALEAYNNASASNMNQEEKAEFTFKKGYSLLKQGELDKAAAAFSQIKDNQTKYTGPASYYYAHVMYEKGNYATALRDFEKLKQDETFKTVVPYYIIQIYYVQGDYNKMLELAKPYLQNKRNKRTNEMLRLVADVYYRQGDFKQAIAMMEEYQETSRGRLSREDSYMLGYSYYMAGAYEKAIPQFQTAASLQDTLSQNAYYHLGDSYLKTNQKQFASNAFISAWKIPVKSALAEDALFNYAKLSVELSNNPYNEAIKALQQYLQEYPNSSRRDEAYTYLANLYLVTKNYTDALTTLESIKKRTPSQESIYQQITYLNGIELFNNQKYYDAIALFKKSLETRQDQKIIQNALYWTGESYYRLGQYEVSRNYYKDFIDRSKGNSNLDAAYYNIAYSHFKLKEYSQAQKAFNTFINSRPKDNRLLNDARLRMADSYFMMKQYGEASRLYEQVVNARATDTDYALYQRALATGVTGDNNQKLAALQRLLSEYPKSQFADDARFEMGKTYLSQRKNAEALAAFQKLINDHPRSSLVRDALLNSGLIYYNTNKNQLALETFKKVVNDYPSTPAAREALAVIRNIYVDMNNVDEYVQYTSKVPFANVSQSEQDSLTFTAAESRYMSGDCNSSLPGFVSYLNKFPNGSFALNAHYYKADCEGRAGNHKGALDSYEQILKHPRNRFTENAALKGSDILYKMGEYARALEFYKTLEENAENKVNLLEALVGQMRSNYKLGNHSQAIESAQQVLERDQISTALASEAHLTIGNSSLELRRVELARTSFNETVKLSKSESGAEALFQLAQIAFDMKDLKTAESNVFKLSSDYPSYQYWLARGFILLSDVYVAQGNTFQAKQTLQSIIDNYEGEDLKKVAREKLARINQDSPGSPAKNYTDDEEGIIIK